MSAKKYAESQSRCWAEAICPRCGKKHKHRTYWTGRGVLKKFCANCLCIVELYDTGDTTKSHLNRDAKAPSS